MNNLAQQSETPQFQSKSGMVFPGISSEDLRSAREELHKEVGVSQSIAAEAASYSMAMVVRFALGLTAEHGAVTGLIADGFSGLIVAATVRHLVNAAGNALCFVLGDKKELSPDLQQQLAILEKMQVGIHYIKIENSADKIKLFSESIARSHNVIYGLFDIFSLHQNNSKSLSPTISNIITVLNDARTPVHCIECPSGIDPDTGKRETSSLYASSTLSLGAPLAGLYNGSENVGRHYLCDISFTRDIYQKRGSSIASLFSEQPVVQIFPVKPKEE